MGGGADLVDAARRRRRPRGRTLRLSMQTDLGEVHTVVGGYREVQPPERLVYTWRWEEGPEPAMAGGEVM